MPFNRDQSTAIRRKGREPPRVARASSAANLQVNALLGNFQGQVDNIMRSLTDQLEQEDAHDAGAAPVGPTEYAMATSSGHKDEHEDDTYQPPYQPPSAVRRLLLIDKQVSPHGHLANAALDCVTVIKYDSADTTLEELLELIRFAHRKQGFPFTSIACAQHGPNEEGLWIWTSDLVVDLGGGSPLSPITQLTPIVEALGMALEKTRMGRAHIDFLACGLAGFAPRLVLGLEKLYGIDFRASTDDTGNDVNGGDWKMETDNDYDVAVDYLDRVKLVAYTEKMGLFTTKKGKKGNEIEKEIDLTTNTPQYAAAETALNDKPTETAKRYLENYFRDNFTGAAGHPLLTDLKEDPAMRALLSFSESEYSSENVEFILAVDELLGHWRKMNTKGPWNTADSQVKAGPHMCGMGKWEILLTTIMGTFVAKDATNQVNLPANADKTKAGTAGAIHSAFDAWVEQHKKAPEKPWKTSHGLYKDTADALDAARKEIVKLVEINIVKRLLCNEKALASCAADLKTGLSTMTLDFMAELAGL